MRKVMSVVVAASMVIGGWAGAARADGERVEAKRLGVTLRLASTTPVNGFQAASVDGARLFVSPKATLSGADVTSALAIEVRGGRDVELTLNRQAAERLAGSLRATGVNQLAVFRGGEPLAAGEVIVDAAVSRATIRGLTTANAEQLVRLVDVRAIPVASSIRMVASQRSIQPGGTVSIEFYLDGTVASLRGYQVSLAVVGGDSGQLTVGGGSADSSHADFVFGVENALAAVDREGARVMAALMKGDISVSASSYLGTMTFQASADARGTFVIRAIEGMSSTVLLNAENMPVAFVMPEPVMLTVGDVRATPTRR